MGAEDLPSAEHGEANHSQYRGTDIREATLACAIGEVANCDGEDSGSGVGWYREELRFCRFVAQSLDDTGQEQGEGVERTVSTHINECV